MIGSLGNTGEDANRRDLLGGTAKAKIGDLPEMIGIMIWMLGGHRQMIGVVKELVGDLPSMFGAINQTLEDL